MQISQKRQGKGRHKESWAMASTHPRVGDETELSAIQRASWRHPQPPLRGASAMECCMLPCTAALPTLACSRHPSSPTTVNTPATPLPRFPSLSPLESRCWRGTATREDEDGGKENVRGQSTLSVAGRSGKERRHEAPLSFCSPHRKRKAFRDV